MDVGGSVGVTSEGEESEALDAVACHSLGLALLSPTLDESPVWVARRALTLGRALDTDVCLTHDSRVSRVHARFEPTGNALRVLDANSRHGTFVDGARVGPTGTVARAGAIVRVGRSLLEIVDNPPRESPFFRRISGASLGLPHDIVAGPALFRCFQLATQVAALPQPALLLGESGSGKEALARVLHAARSTPGPFIALNVMAVPEALFESAMFGHTRGSFSGASSARAGAFREASGGVLFLDEVGDLRLDSQAALLRAIDQGKVRPLGANEDVDVNVRLVAATSRNLEELCLSGRFRKDLYYRLSGIVIRVPPLRERRSDVAALASHFLETNAPGVPLMVETLEILLRASWDGNVRQLQNALTHALARLRATGGRRLAPEHLPELEIATDSSPSQDTLEKAMQRAGGNASQAAKLLGVSRTTLYNLFKRHGIEPRGLRSEGEA